MFNSMYGSETHNLTSQFGAAGGFVPSPAQEAGQASQGAKRFGGSGSQTLRAVTIKQITEAFENAKDDNLKIDGEELNNILIVGRVEAANQMSTYLELEVDDGTGRLEVKLYIDTDDAAAPVKLQECKIGNYVRIHGHLRPLEDKYPLVAFSIKPLVDFNEITYHLLSCIYQHASLTRSAGPGNQATAVPNGMAPGHAAGPAAHKDSFLHHDDPEADVVLQAMNRVGREISVDELMRATNGRFGQHQMQGLLVKLTEAGCAYSTSADHYMTCQI